MAFELFGLGSDVSLAPELQSLPFLAEIPKRTLKAAQKEARWFSIAGGSPLIKAGDQVNGVYFVITGSLAIFRKNQYDEDELVGHIRAGDPVGEIAFMTGGTHQHNVYAIRDTEVIWIPVSGFRRLLQQNADLMERLTQVIVQRLAIANRKFAHAEPKIFLFLASSPTIDLEARAELVASQLEQEHDLKVTRLNEQQYAEGQKPVYEWEAENDVIILEARLSQTSWVRLCLRQADRIWIFGRRDSKPSVPLLPDDPSPAKKLRLVDVILIDHDNEQAKQPTIDWLSGSQAARVLHWRGHSHDDCQRLARTMTGSSVGLVFSGGGARAYAQIGVIRALRETGIPIDFVGGSSMGAVLGACVAMGWNDDEIDFRIRKGFVESNPLGDWSLPIFAMTKGKRVNRRLKEHFGDIFIEDLQLPFFCISTDLTDGSIHIAKTGSLVEGLRASIALPGILPPVVQQQKVLVDGAVLNNFPADVMRVQHRGFTIGVDVARQPEGLASQDYMKRQNSFLWLLKNGFSIPPIISLLMRAATVPVNPNEGRELTHLLIAPDLGKINLRDWKSYDEAVNIGYEETIEMINHMPDEWLKPVRSFE